MFNKEKKPKETKQLLRNLIEYELSQRPIIQNKDNPGANSNPQEEEESPIVKLAIAHSMFIEYVETILTNTQQKELCLPAKPAEILIDSMNLISNISVDSANDFISILEMMTAEY